MPVANYHVHHIDAHIFLVAYLHHHTYRQTRYAHCQRKETE